jgi:ankyrin repeat protein
MSNSHCVVPPGHSEVVESMLTHDPAVNAEDKDGRTPLLLAAEDGEK